MSPIIAVRATLLRVGSAVFVGLIASTAMAQSLAAAPGPALEGTHWRAIELADAWRGPRRLAITGPAPVAELGKQFPKAEILTEPGESAVDSAAIAKRADVAVVFAWKAESEGHDHADLSLPWGQRQIIEAVIAANLSYTTFDYSGFEVTGGDTITATFTVTNTGKVAGADVPQVYLTDAAGDRRMRLLGFERVELAPGASRTVEVTADPRLLARFDGEAGQWRITDGVHRVALGRSAADLVSTAETPLAARVFGK